MVGWLSVRMWAGHIETIWRVSCVLGAWAPVGAAAVLLYVQAEDHRENNPAAAWIVRALGMHCVLLWLLGISDYLRGAPNLPPQWDADQGMPVVFAAFFPVLALSVATLRWALGLSRRLGPKVPGAPTGGARPVGPYRSRLFSPRRAPRPAPPPLSLGPAALMMTGIAAAVWGVSAWTGHAVAAGGDELPGLMRWPAITLAGTLLWLGLLETVLVVRMRRARS